MPTIHKSRIEPYSPEQMFRLVNDVDAYPQFLPWCRHARIVQRSADEELAELEVAKGPFNQKFTTRNRLLDTDERKQIQINLVNGPFKQLTGSWIFTSHPTGCQIDFSLEFAFQQNLFAKLLEPIFSQIGHSMVDAFAQRARVVYGPSAS